MRFAVSKGETNVAELTTRLFDIKGQGAAETAKRTEAALLAANPHLTNLTRVPPGTLIMIPDLPDSPAVRAPQTAGIRPELDDHLKIAVKESTDVIGRSAGVGEAAVAATLDALKDRELKDFAAQSPELKGQLDKLAEISKADLKEIKAATSAEKDAIAQLQEALSKLNL
jgi:hypothetical protein